MDAAFAGGASDASLNGYQFTTLRSLRSCLRSYASLRALSQRGDFTSAAIMLDLNRALGNDPSSPICVMTARQKQAITLHLIQDLPANVVAKEMGIQWRVVYLTVNNGLRRLLRYLEAGELGDTWQPWQLDYVRRNLHLTRKELGDAVGRTEYAVKEIIKKRRRVGDFPTNHYSGQNSSRGPQSERQAS